MMRARITASCFFACLLLGCGGTSTTTPASPPPTSPSPAAPSPNRAPEILSVSVTPSLGVVGLTTFRAHVDARDPDGDPLSIVWSDAGRRRIGDSADLAFQAGHEVGSPLTVTVTDGKGGTATTKADFIAGDITCGSCAGYVDFGPKPLQYFGMQLSGTRTGMVTGTIVDYNDPRTYRFGTTDPAEPGRIDASGRFRIRFKFPLYGGDFVFDGQLMPYDKPREGAFENNYVFAGRVIGGKFDGHTVTFGERPRY